MGGLAGKPPAIIMHFQTLRIVLRISLAKRDCRSVVNECVGKYDTTAVSTRLEHVSFYFMKSLTL